MIKEFITSLNDDQLKDLNAILNGETGGDPDFLLWMTEKEITKRNLEK